MKLPGGQLLAATYSRKSTLQEGIHDEAKSVTRQIEQGRAYAQSKGWSVVAEFVDDGLSGALDADKRPGLKAMLDAAQAKQFDVLLTALPDRIARDQWINAAIMARLAKANIRLFYFLTGREADLKTATGQFLAAVEAFGSAFTRESITGHMISALKQRAEHGHVVGNRTFGYVHRRVNGHVERAPHEPEAKAVRLGAKLYADGWSPTRIVRKLRDLNFPPPSRGGLPRTARTQDLPKDQQVDAPFWTTGPLLAILKNPIYHGEVVSTWKDGTTYRTHNEELRIVDEVTWRRVQARLAETRAIYLRQPNGRLESKPSNGLDSKYLLAGLLECGVCRRAMSVRHWHGRLVYQCRGYVEGYRNNKTPCRNSLPVSMRLADQVILTAIEQQVLTPEVVSASLRRAITRLSKSVKHTERTTLVQNLRQVELELARLTQAVANGGQVQTLVQAIRDAEGRQGRIQDQLDGLDRAAGLRAVSVKSLEPELKRRLKDWSGLLQRHPLQARQILMKLLPVRLTMNPDVKTKRYTFTGQGRLEHLIEGMIPEAEQDLRVAQSQRNWRGSTACPCTWIS
jgi:site-specific DNA recombinase